VSTLREAILNADDLESRTVEVPEWNNLVVELRSPSVERRGEMMTEYMKDGAIDFVRLYPALIVATAFDPETGEPVFTNGDIELLTKKSAKAMERLGAIASELSGMTNVQERVDEGKDSSSPILSAVTSSS